jgi:tripeptidyl-peptidase I
MVAISVFISLVSVLTLACAKPAPRDLVVLERRESVPQGFVGNGAAPSTTTLNLRIALVSSNIAGLEKALYDVSTPSSDLYGQHLTKEEVKIFVPLRQLWLICFQVGAFVAPTSDTTTAVNQWLSSNGLTASPISPAGDMLGVSIPVSMANELFAADFSVFTHQATGEQTIRTLSFSIPASIKSRIEFIHPTTACASSQSTISCD